MNSARKALGACNIILPGNHSFYARRMMCPGGRTDCEPIAQANLQVSRRLSVWVCLWFPALWKWPALSLASPRCPSRTITHLHDLQVRVRIPPFLHLPQPPLILRASNSCSEHGKKISKRSPKNLLQGAPGAFFGIAIKGGHGMWELVRGVSALQTGRSRGGEQAQRR